MRKLNILIAPTLAFVSAFALAACKPNNNAAGDVIPEKPADTSLEFWIAQDVSSIDFSAYYEVFGWFGARQFYGKGYYPESVDEEGNAVEPKHCVKYLVGAYPDEADGGQFIVKIDITDPNVGVYGLTCESAFDEFDNAMQERGYTITKETTVSHTATLGKVKFVLVRAENAKCLKIDVEVTNSSGIDY